MSSSMPHLQAAQRRIWRVVPVKAPSTRGETWLAARASSPVKKSAARPWPVLWLNGPLTRLFSGNGCARTQPAHCPLDGSDEPGATVAKWDGPPATAAPPAGAPPAGGAVAALVAVGEADGLGVTSGLASAVAVTDALGAAACRDEPTRSSPPPRRAHQTPATVAASSPTRTTAATADRGSRMRLPLHTGPAIMRWRSRPGRAGGPVAGDVPPARGPPAGYPCSRTFGP